MKTNKRLIIFISIFTIACIVGLRLMTNSDKIAVNVVNKESIEDSELYVIATGGNGTYTDGLTRYGFIDKSGQVVIEPKYKFVTSFFHGVAYVQDANDNGQLIDYNGYLIDKNENKISTVKGRCVDNFEGLWLTRIDNKWGYVDKTGKWVIEPKYAKVYNFSEGLSAVREDSERFSTWGFMDKNGQWIIKPSFSEVKPFSEGLAATGLNGKWGYIDRTGNWIIKPTFQDAELFSKGLAPVKLNGKWGYIDKKGDLVIKPTFDDVTRFKDDSAIVGKYDTKGNSKEGIINKRGELITEIKYDQIYYDTFSNEGFVFREKNLYGVLNLKGEVAVEPKYTSFIRQDGNKILMDKDTIYFLDKKLNIKNKHKLGKMFPLYYDNKLISIMTKDGSWYFNKDGVLIKKIDDNFSKAFEIVNGCN